MKDESEMGNELKTVLNEVITSRENNAKNYYAPKEKELVQIKECCGKVLSFNDSDLWQKMIEESNLSDSWRDIVSKSESIDSCIASMGIGESSNINGSFFIAKNRSTRPYINIGIVAAFRQGKSTMLKALVGYDDNTNIGYTEEDKKYLIPTSRDVQKPCTGTKIHYINDNYNGKENQAVIVFYTKEEVLKSMLDLAKKVSDKTVYEQVKNEKTIEALQQKLKILLFSESIGKETIDRASGKLGQPGSPEETLWRYVHASKDTFSKLDEDPSPLDISSKEGKENFYRMVCFYKTPDKETDDNRTYEVLGVKEAVVYKRFTINGRDPGKIRFMDTPGIGEARTSVETSLSNALRNEIDVAIAICRIDDVQIEYIKQFNDFIKKDFNIVCVIDEKRYDIKDCFYYVLNVSENSDKDKIREHKDLSIKQSLVSPIKTEKEVVSGIKICDDHIIAIDCKQDIRYKMTDGQDTIEGKTKDVTTLSEGKANGCSSFLLEVLGSLKETIGIIDNYFNHKAIEEYNAVIKYFDSLKTNISDLKLPPFEYSRERIKTTNKIREGIEKDPQYSDTSDDKLNAFIKNGKENIVNEFLKTIYGDKTFEDVILSESDYTDFDELREYGKLKIKFRNYIVKKLIECYDIKSIETAVKECTKSIAQIMIDAGLGEIVTNNANVWFEEFISKYGSNYPELKKLFGNIINVNLATSDIESYVRTDLNGCFHSEVSHNNEGVLLFSKVNETANLFIHWLQDIAQDLINKITDNGTPGIPSFKTLVDKTKQKYRNYYSDLRIGLNNDWEEGYCQLVTFIDANKEHLFKETVRKQQKAEEWTDFVIGL